MKKLELVYDVVDVFDNEEECKNYVLKERDIKYCGLEIFSIKPGKFEEKHRFIKRNPVFVLKDKNETTD